MSDPNSSIPPEIPPEREAVYLQRAADVANEANVDAFYDVDALGKELVSGAEKYLYDSDRDRVNKVNDVIDYVSRTQLLGGASAEAEDMINKFGEAAKARRRLEAQRVADWARHYRDPKNTPRVPHPGLTPISFRISKAINEEQVNVIIERYVEDPDSITLPDVERGEGL